MAKTHRVPITDPSVAASPEPPEIPPAASAEILIVEESIALLGVQSGQSEQPGELPIWTVPAIVAALCATFGFLMGAGLWGEVHTNSVDFALWVIIMALASYLILDPAKDWLHGKHEAPPSAAAQDRIGAAAGAVALTTLVHSACHHCLGASLEGMEAGMGVGDGLLFALLVLGFIGLPAAVVTGCWVGGVSGARHEQQPRARFYGAISGLGGGALVGLYYLHYIQPYIKGHAVKLKEAGWEFKSYWPMLLVVVVLALLWFVGTGYLGGWVVDRRQRGIRPPLRILVALSLFSLVYVSGLLYLTHTLENHPSVLNWLQIIPPATNSDQWKHWNVLADSWAWLPIEALIFQNLGWALGLYFQPESCDTPLGLWGTVKGKPHGVPKRGPVPVPPPGSSAPVPGPGDSPTPAIPPLVLLLKPTGDRLLAAVVLVLALATAGLAYEVGSLRKDPEIDNEVKTRFQQDSGLHKTALIVHSTGRVVTLAGMVDDEIEHAKAVQEASSVRGVKQLIDQIQVAPPMPPTPMPPTPALTVPVPQTPTPAINATISIGGPTGAGKVGAVNAQTPAAPSKTTGSQKPAETPKPADAQKHRGLFHFLKTDKDTKASTPGGQKQTETPKTADTQKKGFFHFLKKKDKTDKTKNDQTKTDKTKTAKPKNDPSH